MQVMTRFLILATFFVASLATAASLSLSTGPTVRLATGTSGGTCKSEMRNGWQRKVVCRDGDNIAIAVAGKGCLRVKGTAFCIVGDEQEPRMPGANLVCTLGASYFLSTGPNTFPQCRRRGDRMACKDRTGGYASANCADGCESTKAGGICCMSGTNGCPPVVEPKKLAS